MVVYFGLCNMEAVFYKQMFFSTNVENLLHLFLTKLSVTSLKRLRDNSLKNKTYVI